MVAAFPAAKLGALVIKQLAKPIATFIKERAKSSPVFRKYVCMPPAQFYNWVEVQAKMWVLNLGKPVKIPVLNEAMAIELGANLLGEGILFAIAAGLLINEYQRSSRKEEKKERELQMARDDMQNTIQELYFLTQKQSAQILELHRQFYDLEDRVVMKPWKPKKSDDDPPENGHPTVPPKMPENEPTWVVIPPEMPENEPPSVVVPPDMPEKHTPSSDDGVDQLTPVHRHPISTAERNGLVLNAVMSLQNELMWSPIEEKGDSILLIAIQHLMEQVYKRP